MLKLLFKPTGNIFTLPDDEVLAIKRQDRANEYQILDSGYTEMAEEKVEEKTVQELVMKQEKRVEEIEAEDKVVEKPKTPVVEKESKLDFEKMNRKQISLVLNRAGYPANENETRKVLFEKLKKAGFIK